jgi:hypothetical protein
MSKHLGFAVLLAVVTLSGAPCAGYAPDPWTVCLYVNDSHAPLGAVIGTHHGSQDGYDGQGMPQPQGKVGMYTLLYRENGPAWTGPTGFFGEDIESPIPRGGNKTWWNIYMWAQNYTPDPPNRVLFATATGDWDLVPIAYTGHLVLDYVPESANWTGPMDFWLDLGRENKFTVPIVTVTNPLDGVRMHITVYAIPEPCSLAVLGAGLIPLALAARRRRRT